MSHRIQVFGEMSLEPLINNGLALARHEGISHDLHVVLCKPVNPGPSLPLVVAVAWGDDGTASVTEAQRVDWSSGVRRVITVTHRLDDDLKAAIEHELVRHKQALAERKHWISVYDARVFAEVSGYSLHGASTMYGCLASGVRPYSGTPWPIEHRVDQRDRIQLERSSLVRFLRSGKFAPLGKGWGQRTKEILFAWLNHLESLDSFMTTPLMELDLDLSTCQSLARVGLKDVGGLLQNSRPGLELAFGHDVVQALEEALKPYGVALLPE